MIDIPEKLKVPTKVQGSYSKKLKETPCLITFAAHLRAYAIYSAIYGNSQTAERLADRGGFGPEELDTFYPEWRNHIIKKMTNDQEDIKSW